MKKEDILSKLCWKDKRNIFYYLEDESQPSRTNCCCDNCFRGNDKLALALLEAQQLLLEISNMDAWQSISPSMLQRINDYLGQ